MSDVRRMLRSGLARRMASFGFNPSQPRDERGRWADAMTGLIQSIHKGGATVEHTTLKTVTTGTMVSIGNEYTLRTPVDTFFAGGKGHEAGRQIIRDWLKAKIRAGVFDDPKVKVGAWIDDGDVWLDPAEQFPHTPAGRKAAILAGRSRDQRSIYNIDTEEFIDTGGTGGY